MFQKKNKGIYSISDGVIIPLEQVNDEVFSKKLMGEGYAINPTNNYIVSPVNGVISMIFPTKHAIGILSEDDLEILIHVGIDTVDIKEKVFDIFVEVGSKVKVGTTLLKLDIDMLDKLGYDTTSMCIITNCNENKYEINTPKEAVRGKTLIIDFKSKEV